jgi:predicted nucleic acid-binding protein
MNYLDTSALIKRFVREAGSGTVDALISQEGSVATSRIAYAEVFSALARRKREGDLSHSSYAVAARQVEAEWMALVRVDVTDDVVKTARRLVERHPLRGFDAIHLASALGLRKELGVELTFAAADRRQLEAARAEGLTVINVEHQGL